MNGDLFLHGLARAFNCGKTSVITCRSTGRAVNIDVNALDLAFLDSERLAGPQDVWLVCLQARVPGLNARQADIVHDGEADVLRGDYVAVFGLEVRELDTDGARVSSEWNYNELERFVLAAGHCQLGARVQVTFKKGMAVDFAVRARNADGELAECACLGVYADEMQVVLDAFPRFFKGLCLEQQLGPFFARQPAGFFDDGKRRACRLVQFSDSCQKLGLDRMLEPAELFLRG